MLENTFLSLPRLVPSALPVLGPFAFLCHQKWDSASKIPLIPAETPMLLLSGSQDEVVPSEHMHELWKLIEQRVPGARRKTEPHGEDADAKDESVELPAGGYSRFVDFPRGTHSTSDTLMMTDPMRALTFYLTRTDDTCVQQGYWQTVADFIARVEAQAPAAP